MPSFCNSCRENAEFYERDGLFYCSICDVQSENMQVMECSLMDSQPSQSMSTQFIRTINVSRKRKADESSISGSDTMSTDLSKPWWIAEIFHIILKAQVQTLIDMGITPKLEDVVKSLWYKYLKNSGWISHTSKAKTGKRKKENKKSKMLKKRMQSDSMKAKVSPGDAGLFCGEVSDLPFRLPHLICIIFLALRRLRQPILLTDLLRWVLEGHLPYYALNVDIPEYIEANLTLLETILFYRPKPSSLQFRKLQEPMRNLYEVMSLPPMPSLILNHVMHRFIVALNLPASFHKYSYQLLRRFPTTMADKPPLIKTRKSKRKKNLKSSKKGKGKCRPASERGDDGNVQSSCSRGCCKCRSASETGDDGNEQSSSSRGGCKIHSASETVDEGDKQSCSGKGGCKSLPVSVTTDGTDGLSGNASEDKDSVVSGPVYRDSTKTGAVPETNQSRTEQSGSKSRERRQAGSPFTEEAPAAAYVIVAIKLLFGLDDKMEYALSDVARKIKEKLPVESNVMPFIWDEWVAAQKLRMREHQRDINHFNPGDARYVRDTTSFISCLDANLQLKKKSTHMYGQSRYKVKSHHEPLQRPFNSLQGSGHSQNKKTIGDKPTCFPYSTITHGASDYESNLANLQDRIEDSETEADQQGRFRVPLLSPVRTENLQDRVQDSRREERVNDEHPVNIPNESTSGVEWLSKKKLTAIDFSKHNTEYLVGLRPFCESHQITLDNETTWTESNTNHGPSFEDAGPSKVHETNDCNTEENAIDLRKQDSESQQDRDALSPGDERKSDVRNESEELRDVGVDLETLGYEEWRARILAGAEEKEIEKESEPCQDVARKQQMGVASDVCESEILTVEGIDLDVVGCESRKAQNLGRTEEKEEEREKMNAKLEKQKKVKKKKKKKKKIGMSHNEKNRGFSSSGTKVNYVQYGVVPVGLSKPFHDSYQWLLEHCAALFGLEWEEIHKAVQKLENKLFKKAKRKAKLEEKDTKTKTVGDVVVENGTCSEEFDEEVMEDESYTEDFDEIVIENGSDTDVEGVKMDEMPCVEESSSEDEENVMYNLQEKERRKEKAKKVEHARKVPSKKAKKSKKKKTKGVLHRDSPNSIKGDEEEHKGKSKKGAKRGLKSAGGESKNTKIDKSKKKKMKTKEILLGDSLTSLQDDSGGLNGECKGKSKKAKKILHSGKVVSNTKTEKHKKTSTKLILLADSPSSMQDDLKSKLKNTKEAKKRMSIDEQMAIQYIEEENMGKALHTKKYNKRLPDDEPMAMQYNEKENMGKGKALHTKKTKKRLLVDEQMAMQYSEKENEGKALHTKKAKKRLPVDEQMAVQYSEKENGGKALHTKKAKNRLPVDEQMAMQYIEEENGGKKKALHTSEDDFSSPCKKIVYGNIVITLKADTGERHKKKKDDVLGHGDLSVHGDIERRTTKKKTKAKKRSSRDETSAGANQREKIKRQNKKTGLVGCEDICTENESKINVAQKRTKVKKRSAIDGGSAAKSTVGALKIKRKSKRKTSSLSIDSIPVQKEEEEDLGNCTSREKKGLQSDVESCVGSDDRPKCRKIMIKLKDSKSGEYEIIKEWSEERIREKDLAIDLENLVEEGENGMSADERMERRKSRELHQLMDENECMERLEEDKSGRSADGSMDVETNELCGMGERMEENEVMERTEECAKKHKGKKGKERKKEETEEENKKNVKANKKDKTKGKEMEGTYGEEMIAENKKSLSEETEIGSSGEIGVWEEIDTSELLSEYGTEADEMVVKNGATEDTEASRRGKDTGSKTGEMAKKRKKRKLYMTGEMFSEESTESTEGSDIEQRRRSNGSQGPVTEEREKLSADEEKINEVSADRDRTVQEQSSQSEMDKSHNKSRNNEIVPPVIGSTVKEKYSASESDMSNTLITFTRKKKRKRKKDLSHFSK